MTDTSFIYLAIVSDSYNERSEIVYLGNDRFDAEIRLYARYCELCNTYEDEMQNSKSFRYSSQETFIKAASDELSTAYIQYDDFDMTVPHRINFELRLFVHVQNIYEPMSCEYKEITDEKQQSDFYHNTKTNDKNNGYELV